MPHKVGPTTAGAAIVVIAVIFPFIFNDYLVRAATTIIMLAILAEAWNLIGGYAGYPSFGHVAFFGLGAYAAAVSMSKLGAPFPIGFLLGGLMGAFLAMLIGLPILRLRGHYFAIATLGIFSVMREITIATERLTGGGAGISLPLPGLDLQSFDELIYLTMLATLLACVGFTFWMAQGRLGNGLAAIRENEIAARVMGVNSTRYKVVALTVRGLFAGFAGATYAYWLSSIDPPTAYDSTYNVLLVIMAFFGGAGTVLGPALGALILGIVSEWLRGLLVQLHLLVFGVVIVLTIIFAPNGLMEYVGRHRRLSLRSFLENVREHRV